MILDLSKKHNIDLEKSYMIGDSYKDIQAGENAGVKSILIEKDYNQDVKAENKVKTLNLAVELIKKKS